jgi:uncharacterized integral membrane protein
MKIISRIVAVILFIAFFGFALKNSQEVELQFFFFFFENTIIAPLVLLLLGFFAAGAALGVLAMTPTLFRHRRDLNRHKKAIDSMRKEGEAQQMARVQPPQPDTVLTK